MNKTKKALVKRFKITKNGKFIEKMIGSKELTYFGIQMGLDNKPFALCFHDNLTQTDLCARSLRQMITKLAASRREYGFEYKYSLGVEV